MEPAVVWVPGDFQLVADWTTMEPAAVCAPGIPVESYVSTDMFGSCFQTPVPTSSSEGHVVVEFAAATNKIDQSQVDFHGSETKTSDPLEVFAEASTAFEVEILKMEKKIHTYPAVIKALPKRYTSPTMVAIGPYHHGRCHLMPAEKIKHVAAYQCLKVSQESIQTLYDAVVSEAHDARDLYDKDRIARVNGDDDFLPMMFYDACFLVQYMLTWTKFDNSVDSFLRRFFNSNDEDIFHDILLLDNQIPWPVVKAIMKFVEVPLEELVAHMKGVLRDRKDTYKDTSVWDCTYEPPHLLGLVRHYIVGKGKPEQSKQSQTKFVSVSVSAVELAEMGVTITRNKTGQLIDMGLEKKEILAELSLAPLSLDATRASLLVNMAALELCTIPNFQDQYGKAEDSAVCSYLLLLTMIVSREEDVHELRTNQLLEGGGFTNNAVLQFLGELQGLRVGSAYIRTMYQVENYKLTRSVPITGYTFVYKNKKTISLVCTTIAGLAAFLGTLKSLKGS